MMKLRAVAGTAVIMAAIAGSSAIAQAQQYVVFPGSSGRAIADYELESLTCQDLWVARNELYHRGGYCFKSRRGRNFFGNQGCYTKSPRFSRTERNNVARIKRWEGRLGCR